MAVCSAINEDVTLIMSNKKVAEPKSADTTSVKVDLTPEQNDRVDNHAMTYSSGAKTTRIAMDGIFEELGGMNPDNHRKASTVKRAKVEEHHAGIFFQPDSQLFDLIQTRFNLTFAKCERGAIKDAEEHLAKVSTGYMPMDKEQIDAKIQTRINNAWKAMYYHWKMGNSYPHPLDFFKPNEIPYASSPPLKGMAKFKKDIRERAKNMNKIIRLAGVMVIRNKTIRDNPSLSPDAKELAMCHGIEQHFDDIEQHLDAISKILPEKSSE